MFLASSSVQSRLLRRATPLSAIATSASRSYSGSAPDLVSFATGRLAVTNAGVEATPDSKPAPAAAGDEEEEELLVVPSSLRLQEAVAKAREAEQTPQVLAATASSPVKPLVSPGATPPQSVQKEKSREDTLPGKLQRKVSEARLLQSATADAVTDDELGPPTREEEEEMMTGVSDGRQRVRKSNQLFCEHIACIPIFVVLYSRGLLVSAASRWGGVPESRPASAAVLSSRTGSFLSDDFSFIVVRRVS